MRRIVVVVGISTCVVGRPSVTKYILYLVAVTFIFCKVCDGTGRETTGEGGLRWVGYGGEGHVAGDAHGMGGDGNFGSSGEESRISAISDRLATGEGIIVSRSEGVDTAAGGIGLGNTGGSEVLGGIGHSENSTVSS